jgi:hypothetical protein
VLSDELIVGKFYAYREKRSPSSPRIKVRLLDKVGRKGKIKVRFDDGPHPGLEEYISTRQLVVPWSQHRAFLRDEEREALIDEHCREVGDRVIAEAATTVLAASGEPSAYAGELGYLCMPEDELQRIADRAGIDARLTDLHLLGFCDRANQIHLPFEAAVAIARAFAAAEPETVLMDIDAHEERLRSEGYAPGSRYKHDLMRQYKPAWAVARQWAGLERESEMLQKEIGRLRGLVSQAAYKLQSVGQEREGARLLRALDGR